MSAFDIGKKTIVPGETPGQNDIGWLSYKGKPVWNNGAEFSTGAIFDSLADVPAGVVGPVWVGGEQYTRSGNQLIKSLPVVARVVKNILLPQHRFANAVELGDGSATKTITETVDGVKNSKLTCNSGAAGRAYANLPSNPVTAGKWYSLSFDVFSVSWDSSTLQDVAGSYTGVAIDRGSSVISFAKVAAGGPGRYASVFRAATTGTMDFRIGLGTGANAVNQSIEVGNYMLEELDIANGFTPSEYVYPGYSAVFTSNKNLALNTDNNKIELATSSPKFPIKPYSNILAIGDSRMDEINDIGGKLQTLMNADGSGNCNWHAQGGWRAEHIISTGTNQGVSFNLTKLLNGSALTGALSSNGDEEVYDYLYPNSYYYDTLLIADFGYNSIAYKLSQGKTVAVAATETIEELDTIAAAAALKGLSIVMTDNNPFGAYEGVTADQISGVKLLNKYIENYCRQNGHIFVSIYQALSDATTEDNLAAAYSADGLHLNADGAELVATRIKAAIDRFK